MTVTDERAGAVRKRRAAAARFAVVPTIWATGGTPAQDIPDKKEGMVIPTPSLGFGTLNGQPPK